LALQPAKVLLLSIVVYLAGTILIGYWASRKVRTSGDFMLAGRSLPMVLSTSALFATWFGSETVFGASSEFLKGGLYSVIEDPFGAALCLILFGLFFARKLYQMNLVTLGDFFKVRFGQRTELFASVFIVPSYIGYIAAQLVAMGLILNIVTGMETWQGVVVSSVIVTFYTCIGGMWAISITDFIQSIIIVIGLGVLAWVLADQAGGVQQVWERIPNDSLRFFPSLDSYSILSWLAAWSVLGLGSIPSQDVFQRAMSAGSARIAVHSSLYAAGLYLTIAMLPLFISLCTQQLYPDQLQGDTQLALPAMVLRHTPLLVQVLFFGSLLSAIMSTTSSAVLAPAAIFSENLVRPLTKNKLNDQQLLRLTRISVLVFAAVATAMACWRSNIYELVGESSVFSLVSLFMPLTFGLYFNWPNSWGAGLSMAAGLLSWLVLENMETEVPPLLTATAISFLGLVIGSLAKRWRDRAPT
jgi:SSS family solute:Na+ symporter